MTEDEYKTLPGADRLPLLAEDDGRCEKITRPNSPAYDTVRDAVDLPDALRCTRDTTLEFRGGIRYEADAGVKSVHAYFWKRR